MVMGQGPVQPASYGYQRGPIHGGPPAHACGPGCNTCGPGGLSPNTVYELLPDDRFSHGDELHWAAFSSAFKHVYFRVEYLNWDIDGPGQKNVGAPRASGDERDLFPAIDPISQINLGQARIATLDNIGLQNNNGIRGVLGLPTRVGLFEASVSVLEQGGAHSVIRQFNDPFTRIPVIPAITLLENGAPSDTKMILFNQGINAQIQTELFTTELNYIMNPLTPNQPLIIQPMFGFQYVRFWDTLNIVGSDVDVNNPANVLNRRINSEAKNNIFAPQIGFRAEFVHENFSIGVTPKFMLGFNRHRDQVFSEQIFTATEERMTTQGEASEFSPGLDLAVHGKFHLNEHFSLFVSYQLLYMNNVSRATENLVFDSIGTQPNIRLNQQTQSSFVEGLTIGGEYRFH